MSDEPVITGTRIPIARIVYLLSQGYSVRELHKDFSWVTMKVLKGIIDEIVEIVNKRALMSAKFRTYRLLLDENMPARRRLPLLNRLFDEYSDFCTFRRFSRVIISEGR